MQGQPEPNDPSAAPNHWMLIVRTAEGESTNRRSDKSNRAPSVSVFLSAALSFSHSPFLFPALSLYFYHVLFLLRGDRSLLTFRRRVGVYYTRRHVMWRVWGTAQWEDSDLARYSGRIDVCRWRLAELTRRKFSFELSVRATDVSTTMS